MSCGGGTSIVAVAAASSARNIESAIWCMWKYSPDHATPSRGRSRSSTGADSEGSSSFAPPIRGGRIWLSSGAGIGFGCDELFHAQQPVAPRAAGDDPSTCRPSRSGGPPGSVDAAETGCMHPLWRSPALRGRTGEGERGRTDPRVALAQHSVAPRAAGGLRDQCMQRRLGECTDSGDPPLPSLGSGQAAGDDGGVAARTSQVAVKSDLRIRTRSSSTINNAPSRRSVSSIGRTRASNARMRSRSGSYGRRTTIPGNSCGG